MCEYFHWPSIAHRWCKLYETRLKNILKYVQYSSWKVLLKGRHLQRKNEFTFSPIICHVRLSSLFLFYLVAFFNKNFNALSVLLCLDEYLKLWIFLWQSKCQEKSTCIYSGKDRKAQVINTCISMVRFTGLYLRRRAGCNLGGKIGSILWCAGWRWCQQEVFVLMVKSAIRQFLLFSENLILVGFELMFQSYMQF